MLTGITFLVSERQKQTQRGKIDLTEVAQQVRARIR